jgi:hypothetical protein
MLDGANFNVFTLPISVALRLRQPGSRHCHPDHCTPNAKKHTLPGITRIQQEVGYRSLSSESGHPVACGSNPKRKKKVTAPFRFLQGLCHPRTRKRTRAQRGEASVSYDLGSRNCPPVYLPWLSSFRRHSQHSNRGILRFIVTARFMGNVVTS